MLPVLLLAKDGAEHSLQEARDSLEREFALTPEERGELLPSGRQRRFDNRVAWAKSFLEHAKLLTTPRREDRLGLDMIYIQAKRWEGTVGRPEIHRFVGALQGKRARKGVFITTGSFSTDARSYVAQIDVRVVLIDGRELANYMLDFDLGVTSKATYQLKRIDSDYFSDE